MISFYCLKTQHNTNTNQHPSNLPNNSMLIQCYIEMQWVYLYGVYIVPSPPYVARERGFVRLMNISFLQEPIRLIVEVAVSNKIEMGNVEEFLALYITPLD